MALSNLPAVERLKRKIGLSRLSPSNALSRARKEWQTPRFSPNTRRNIDRAVQQTNFINKIIEPFESRTTRRLLGPVIEAPAIAMMNDQQRASYKPVSFGGESLAKDVTGVWKGAANTAGLAYGGGTGTGLATTGVLSAFSGKDALKKLPDNMIKGGFYSAVSNPIIDKVAGGAVARVGGSGLNKAIASRAIKGGVMGTGNLLEDVATSRGLGIDSNLTPKSAAFSFGVGALMGSAGRGIDPNALKATTGRLPNKIHPEDVGVLDQAMDVLQNKKAKLEGIEDTEYGKQINLLADKYLKKEEIDKIVTKTRGKDMRKYYVELGKAIQKKSREVEPDYGFADKMFGKLGIVDDDPLIQEARKYKSAEEFVKAQQFKKISMENPMIDSYHLGIRDVSDIKSYKEALNDPESFVYPDFTKGMAEKAMRSGEITIYSSKPLDKSLSQFVTPSKMMASDYAGNGKVYSKKVSIDDIAWINGDEGNFVGTSQLTDIWNKANQPINSPYSMGIVGNSPVKPNKQPSKVLPDKVQIGNTTSNYNLLKSKANKKNIKKALDEVAPEFEKAVGGPITHDSIIKASLLTNDSLIKEIGREQTEKLGAAQLSLRNNIARLADADGVTPELLDAVKRDAEFARSTAQLLGQRNIDAIPSTLQGRLKIDLLTRIAKVTEDMDIVYAAAKNVDFNKKDQVEAFYRQFIAPKRSEWLDLVRYNSMLSSPLTHINNVVSNFQGTGLITPIEKTITGGVDWIGATLGNRPRKYYAGEGAKFAEGYVKNLGKATKNFIDVMSNKKMSDLSFDEMQFSLSKKGTPARLAENTLRYPQKLLQAMDEFFTTATKGGLESSLGYRYGKQGVENSRIGALAEDEARKRLFNSELGRSEEGALLKTLEFIPNKIMEARNSDIGPISFMAKFTFPFARVPANILKQSVEYSPAGFLTTVGAKNKEEQIAKAIMGTSIAMTTGLLLSSNRLTWAEPANQKRKNAFRAAGMQPYSVKIGDKWVSYTKLHPAISFNLAFAAAWKDAHDNKSLSDDELDTIASSFAKWLNFYADQSYVKNMGDLVNAAKGDENGVARMAANYPQQVIPFRALSGWLARLFDPYQRTARADGTKIEKQLDYFKMQIPLLSQTLPARTDLMGEPVPNQNRAFNAFSPLRVTTENAEKKAQYDSMIQASKDKKRSSEITDALKTGKQLGDIEIVTAQNGLKYAVDGDSLKFVNDKGDVETVSLDVKPAKVELYGDPVLDKEILSEYKSDNTTKISNVVKLFKLGVITKEEATQAITELKTFRKLLDKASKGADSKSGTKKGRKLSIPELDMGNLAVSRSSAPKLSYFDEINSIYNELETFKPIKARML